MKSALLHDDHGMRTFALILATGDEVVATLTAFAGEHRLRGSSFSAVGACSSVVVAFFEWTTKRYREIPISEQVEVLSMVGDITLEQERPKIPALVRPTLEIVLTETPRHLRRRFDPASGLALIDPSA